MISMNRSGGSPRRPRSVLPSRPDPRRPVPDQHEFRRAAGSQAEQVVGQQLEHRVGVAEGAVDDRRDRAVALPVRADDVDRHHLRLSPLRHEVLPSALLRSTRDASADVDPPSVHGGDHATAHERARRRAAGRRADGLRSSPQCVVGDAVGVAQRRLVVHEDASLGEELPGCTHRVRLPTPRARRAGGAQGCFDPRCPACRAPCTRPFPGCRVSRAASRHGAAQSRTGSLP